MAEAPAVIATLPSLPGIKRDGTDLDNPHYQDGQWVRFQRGRPRMMGGYRSVTQIATGPIRAVLSDSRNGANTLHLFSPWGVQRLQFDNSGAGGGLVDRTPSGFTRNDRYTWQADRMYSQSGSPFTALLAAATPDLDDLASDAAGPVYAGDITGTGALTAVSDGTGQIQVSGGLVVLQPFLFVYGSNGLIRNSNANDFSSTTGWATGGSNYSVSANPAGTKIVKGLPLRGGSQTPAGLFWALDALIRVSFVGGTRIWSYDTVSTSTSVLSKSGIIEYDGVYFWAGVDRFLMYNGVVQEVPNQMNVNWFFEGLNYAERQKVWAFKIPRFGEIWWFFPKDNATECTHAVCYNVREGTWYDCEWRRTSGYQTQVFRYPIAAGGEDSRSTAYLTYTVTAGAFNVGDTVTGSISGASGRIVRLLPGAMNLIDVGGTFVNGDSLANGAGATGTATANQQAQQLDVVWQHEFGHDKILGQQTFAIRSFFKTTNMGFPTGGPSGQGQPDNLQTRLVRVEPDFIQSGPMSIYVEGRNFPNAENIISAAQTFEPTTPFVDFREQRRQLALTFESNVQGGYYEMGRVLITVAPGDRRGT